MKTLQIEIPDFVEVDAKDLKFILASTLYEQGKLSLGQAAELNGVSKRTFTELLGQYGVSVFNYDAGEVEDDVKNA
jgi:predicted HTH domain antitoxin